MKTLYQSLLKFIKSEVFKYLFFGVLATIVYTVCRIFIFSATQSAILSSLIATIIAILFAFFTNDTFVFNQVKQGWWARLIKFFTARLSTLVLDLILAYLFVTKFPHIIGQFINNQLNLVNLIETVISQFLIIVINYFLSKFLIFKNKK